jgi:hypothetical protein
MPRPPSGDLSAGGDRVDRALGSEHYESFVIRVLVDVDGYIARGQLTHVASGQRLQFTEPERVPDLIRRLAVASAAHRGPVHEEP